MTQVLGIDIGGSGIKGAVVDVGKGELVTKRFRLPTPSPARPSQVANVVSKVATHFGNNGLIGCTFPGVVREGIVFSAAHLDESFVGKNVEKILGRKTGAHIFVVNDADAAGIAEMEFGAGRGKMGLVVMLTFGTGIGCALFHDGRLIPNVELGHLEIRGKDAEERVSDRIRVAKALSWKEWTRRLEEYLSRLEFLLSPDLFIIGGGVSREHARFIPRLHLRTPVVPAQFLNQAGIVGAAIAAEARFGSSARV